MASKSPPSDLAAWLAAQRWFASKTRRIVATHVLDRLRIGDGTLYVLAVALDDGVVDRYVAALLPGPGIVDAFDDAGFCQALLDVVARSAEVRGERGTLLGRRSRAFPATLAAERPARRLAGEQSNTSVVFGDALIMKQFRRLADGINPDLEITRFLTEHTTFRGTPRLAGALEYASDAAASATLAVVQEFVRDGRDGWRWMLERLAAGDAALDALARLGARTAALHTALATPTADPAFGTEPITTADVAAWAEDVRRQIAAARAAAGHDLADAPDVAGATGLGGLVGRVKIRHHGDFHLGQTLCVGNGGDFMIIDFEGEPLRPLEERRRKHTPLRDVAGMLRSLHYAVATAERGAEEAMRRAFLAGYRETAAGAPFVPASAATLERAIAVFELEKAAYEIVYEAGHRPDWIGIPLAGYRRAISALTAPPAAAGAA